MAKAKRIKTRYPGVYRVGDRYEWISKRSGHRGTCATAVEARDAKRAADSAEPVAAEAAKASFGGWARDWIDAYPGRTRRGFSESSRQRYRESLELYAIPYFDGVRKRAFADVRKPDMRAFVAWLADHERRGGRALSPATIQRTLAPVQAMYAQAIEDGVLPTANPATVRVNVQAAELDPDADAEDRRAFSADELANVLAAAGEHRLLLELLAQSGVRWGELAELRGRDLNATATGPVLTVRRAWSVKTGVVKLPKSAHGRRDLPLSPDLARGLWRLQREPGALLFTSPLGQRLNYANTLRRVLVPILATASPTGPDVTWAAFHTFRHTCASLLFAHGRNVKQVSRWLGHHKASFTLDTYIHLLGDEVGEALDLDAILPGGTRGAPTEPQTGRNEPKAAASESGYLQAEAR